MITVQSRSQVESAVQEILSLCMEIPGLSIDSVSLDQRVSDLGFAIDGVLRQFAIKFELSEDDLPNGDLNDFDSTGNDVVDHLCEYFGIQTQKDATE